MDATDLVLVALAKLAPHHLVAPPAPFLSASWASWASTASRSASVSRQSATESTPEVVQHEASVSLGIVGHDGWGTHDKILPWSFIFASYYRASSCWYFRWYRPSSTIKTTSNSNGYDIRRLPARGTNRAFAVIRQRSLSPIAAQLNPSNSELPHD